MHPAAILAATIIVLGLYLALAATLAFTTGWTGIGMVGIALTGAIAMTLASAPTASARRTART